MFSLKSEKKINTFFSKQIVFTAIGLAAVVLIAIPFAKNISKQYKINSEIKELEKEINEFEAKKLELKETLEYLESDQFAREQARVNLNYKEAGEQVVVIKDTDALSEDTVSTILREKSIIKEEKSNLSRWWHYFFLR